MTRSAPPLCVRVRTLLPGLATGRPPDSALLRHAATCPRCRATLRRESASSAPPDASGYVLAVVRAAGLARLASLLDELARACAAQARHGPATRGATGRNVPALRAPSLWAEVQALRRRLGTGDLLADEPVSPTGPPTAGSALQAARACLLAAERLEGPSPGRQLELAACAVAAHDVAGAGAICSGLVARAGTGALRARLARRATRVARAWGVAPESLVALLVQPDGAGCN